MNAIINLSLACLALIASWCWLAEHNRRRRESADYTARLRAAFTALREYQAANDYLVGEVRKREAAIGRHLARQNAEAVARVAASQRSVNTCFSLGLPVHRVDIRQINWN